MKNLKRFNESSDDITITFKDNGVDKISFYTGKSFSEISSLLHKSNIREQMANDFRKEIKDLSSVSDTTLGYVIETIKNKRYQSTITDIKQGDSRERYGIIK